MPANTYTLIEKIVVGAAGASSITFTSIPQTYTDLLVVCSTRNTGSGVANYHDLYFNGVKTSFTGRFLEGSGSAVSSGTSQYAGLDDGGGATASTFSNSQYYIPNYTSANNKSYGVDSVTENNATTSYMTLVAGLWSNTAAITSVGVAPQTGNFAQYSTFYLYGIAKEGVSPSPSSAPYATGGDRIVFDGTYWYHAFTSSGTFTPRKGLTCDVLVVAGGGGGGLQYGGGGGAGGVSYQTGRSTVNATAYTVTIGAGGNGATNTGGAVGSTGSNSVFDTITSNGGGGGGGFSAATTGGNGGSGGGGGSGVTNPSTSTAGTATQGNSGGATGYGNNGGIGRRNGNVSGGGGGGAGAAGTGAPDNGGSSNGGAGGIGLNTWSSWLTATSTGVSGYIAAGGGGGSSGTRGTGGTGGGGDGGSMGGVNSTNAVANTGSGGGGGYEGSGTSNGANGGSGIVIVRYAA